jgi:hypothetical protein
MRYTCVDSSGPTKQVNIELVDLLEKAKNSENPKKRSLIYMKIAPQIQSEEDKTDTERT